MQLALTRMQQTVFHFIENFAEDNGFPPSYSEIAKHFNFSSDGTVRTYLEQLEKKGYIQRLGRARGIKILRPSTPKSIPILGKIAAGAPIDAIESHNGTIAEIPSLASKPNRFGLEIKGDSMIEAGIFEGDIAIIEKTTQIRSGQIAAVLIDDEATLKRVEISPTVTKLHPENQNYEPIILQQGIFEANLLGKYIGLIREA